MFSRSSTFRILIQWCFGFIINRSHQGFPIVLFSSSPLLPGLVTMKGRGSRKQLIFSIIIRVSYHVHLWCTHPPIPKGEINDPVLVRHIYGDNITYSASIHWRVTYLPFPGNGVRHTSESVRLFKGSIIDEGRLTPRAIGPQRGGEVDVLRVCTQHEWILWFKNQPLSTTFQFVQSIPRPKSRQEGSYNIVRGRRRGWVIPLPSQLMDIAGWYIGDK